MSKEAGYICIDLDADSLEGIPDSLKSVANHSYAELSPSGNGIHIWFKGEWPGEKSKQGKAIRYTKDKYKVEFYYETGYLTMTGNTLNDLDIEENQDMIDFLYNMTQHNEKPSSTKVKTQPKTSLEDAAVLKQVLKNKLNEQMYKTGDISKFDNDQSKADYALCKAFAKVSTDAEQIERLFRQSALFRDEPIKAKTYPARTIASAMLHTALEKEKDLALLLEEDAEGVDQKVLAYERTFFGGDKGTTFIPKWLGDNIMKEYPVFYNGTHTYIYRNGVYHRDDGGIIGRIVVEKLGDMFKRDRLRETISTKQMD
jgi:putative DNA primase/helicase